jgi:hypothetical protein
MADLQEAGINIRIEIVHSSNPRLQSLLSADENHEQIQSMMAIIVGSRQARMLTSAQEKPPG